MSQNKNLKIVGFFGQSGSGKTTIIRNTDKKSNGRPLIKELGIIRYLFKKNDYYLNPKQLIDENYSIVEALTDIDQKNAKIDEIYEKYIRSQFQLLNDWSTEIYIKTTETYYTPTILLVDRSPIDFYVLSMCGMNKLIKKFGKEPNSTYDHFIKLIKKTAESNTNNFLNAVFVTKPWKSDSKEELIDGVRDQYLDEEYTGTSWYDLFDDIKLYNTKVFFISSDITDLKERANLVDEKLKEI